MARTPGCATQEASAETSSARKAVNSAMRFSCGTDGLYKKNGLRTSNARSPRVVAPWGQFQDATGVWPSISIQAEAIEVAGELHERDRAARAQAQGHGLLEEVLGLRLGETVVLDQRAPVDDAGDAGARHE